MTFTHILIYASACLASGQAREEAPAAQQKPGSMVHKEDGLPRWKPPVKKKTVRPEVARYSPLAAAGGYQGQTRTWYDALFEKLNPRSIDWGAVIEERKENLRYNLVQNPFTWYAIGGVLFGVFGVTGWLMTRADREIILRECSLQVARAVSLAEEGKAVAVEAVAQYNAHASKCNLVADALVSGRPAPEMSEYAQLKQRYDRMVAERADAQTQVARLEAELAREKAQMGSLNERLKELERHAKDIDHADDENTGMLVARIGRLEDDLRRSTEEARKWKEIAQRSSAQEAV